MQKICKIFLIIFFSLSFSLTANAALFDNYVAVGDSLTHGFQSGAVDETRQPFSYPSLIAKKTGSEFDQPLLKFPGYLINIEDFLKGNISWWQYYYPLVGGVRADHYDNQNEIDNFGVTGADIKDGLGTKGSSGGYFELVLGPDGKSQLEQALSQDPSFMTFWLGNNDVLGAALACDVEELTPINDFREKLNKCMEKIIEKSYLNNGSLEGAVLVNVPDVTSIAYLQELDDPDFEAGSYAPFWTISPSQNMMLSPDDIAFIKERAKKINEEIEYAAMANGFGFVDSNSIFADINEYGHALKDSSGNSNGEIVITTDYLGGLFSLDGVHPSNIGHSIAANAIIDEVNSVYLTDIENVDEIKASATDSLFKNPVDPRGYIDGWVADAIYLVVELFM